MMAILETLKRDIYRFQLPGWKLLKRRLKRSLPTRLYTRSVLIVIIPMLLLQTVVAAVFMERHWRMVTERLSEGTTRDIAAPIAVIQADPDAPGYSHITRIANELDPAIAIEPGGEPPPPRPKPFFSILDGILADQISDQIHRPFWIDTVGDSRLVEIRIKL